MPPAKHPLPPTIATALPPAPPGAYSGQLPHRSQVTMAEAAAAKGAPIPSATKSQSPPTAISCLLVDHANARTLQVS